MHVSAASGKGNVEHVCSQTLMRRPQRGDVSPEALCPLLHKAGRGICWGPQAFSPLCLEEGPLQIKSFRSNGARSRPVPSCAGPGTIQDLQLSDCGVTVSPYQAAGGEEQVRTLSNYSPTQTGGNGRIFAQNNCRRPGSKQGDVEP